MDDQQRAHLIRGAAALGLSLSDTAVARFARFAALLSEANQALNLTRVPEDAYVDLHLLDSLALAAVITPPAGARLIDVGTGAGFPGIPLAIVFPEVQVTLLDATRKRLDFLGAAIAELALPHVRIVHGRAEECARQAAFREQFDLVTARAVAKMTPLAAWLLPFTRVNGVAVAYKSRNAGEEIEAALPAIRAAGGALDRVADIAIPETDIVRKLVVMRKVRSVPLRAARSAASRSSAP